MFASQGAPPPVSTTPVVNLPLVSTTPAAKLPQVSMTPAANFYVFYLKAPGPYILLFLSVYSICV
jgi:hypothetical protein